MNTNFVYTKIVAVALLLGGFAASSNGQYTVLIDHGPDWAGGVAGNQATIDFFNNNFQNATVSAGDYSDTSSATVQASLVGADVLVLCRTTSSGAYDSSDDTWYNSNLTIPVIDFTSFTARSGKLGWESGDADYGSSVSGNEATVTASGAAVFGTAGVFDWYSGTASFSAAGTGTVGDGDILATIGGNHLVVGWNTGDLNASGATFSGNRLLFNISDNGNNLPDTATGQQALIDAISAYTPLVQTGITNSTGTTELTLIEAEYGTLGGEFSINTFAGVTNITISPTGAGYSPGSDARVATYAVTFEAADTYQLYARLYVGSATFDDDSFFYAKTFGTKSSTTDADWYTINALADPLGFTAASDVVTSGSGSAATEVWKWVKWDTLFTVNEGSLNQTFQIGGREDGLYIDKLVFGAAGSEFTVQELDNASPAGLPLKNHMLPVLTNGNLVVIYRGSAGRDYALETATSLTQEVAWAATRTNTADSTGLAYFTNSLSDLQAFYRVLDVTRPDPVTNVTATVGHELVSLSWAAISDATSYNVKRALDPSGPYTTITNVTTAYFVDYGLTNGIPYYYIVTTLNADGESVASQELSATPEAVPPTAPTGLTAMAGNSQVSLQWTASLGATSYNVMRSTTNGGPYAVFTNVTATSCVNTGLVNDTTYYFVVSALNSIGEGPVSSQASATPVIVSYKPRVIVTTDMGADPDDEQSMVRLLASSCEFDIEGLITSTSCWRKNQSSTSMVDGLINAYAQARPNLIVHADGYPTVAYLNSISKLGQTGYSMGAVGAGKDSPGSELIIAAVDKDDPRPVWIGFWGGGNTLAQAIWKVQTTRSAGELTAFLSKIRVFDILGQDEAGAWMTKNFPDLFYIRATAVYGWAPSDSWLASNVQTHGPLGAAYPDRKYATEGDSPAFMHLFPVGLHDPEQIDQGGWGGRFSYTKQANLRGMNVVTGESVYDPYYMYPNTSEGSTAISRWSNGYNNDFQARMDWSITSNYADANHHPIAAVNGNSTRQVMEIPAAAGSTVGLNAAGSSDPDGDALVYSWQQYIEPSSYKSTVTIQNSATASATVQIPSNAGGKSIHVILELHDNGSPNLYAYRRVIINVQ